MSDYGTIDLSGTLVTASGVAACKPRALTVYGSSTQDGTPTPSAPVAIQSVATANLLDDGAPSEVTSRGITVTPESDGWFRVSGTSTGTSAGVAAIWGSSDLDLPAGTYTAVVETDGTPFVASMLRLQVYASSALAYISDAGTYQLNATSAITRIGIHFAASSAGTVVNGRFRIAVYAGSTACPYVLYGNVGLWAKRTSDASTYTVTPVPLDGHELRSLPDGTRDELTVDEYGHAVLTQRVGSVTLDGSIAPSGAIAAAAYFNISTLGILPPVLTTRGSMGYCNRYEVNSNFITSAPVDNRVVINASVFSGTPRIAFYDSTHAGSFATWLASNPVTVLYQLATPQTIDLGTVELANLTSPDLTAQTVPSAEFALTALLKTGRSTVMWDGEELGAGWTFVSDRREQLLPTDVATIDVPGRDGALFGGVTRAVRQVTLALYVLGPVGERAPHVRELAARLAVDGPRPLMFSDEAPLWRMAVPNAESDSEVYYDAEGYTDVDFVCTDPWLYGEERSVTVPSGGSVTFTVGGTAPTWPTITASATGSSQGTWILRLDDSSQGVYAAIASGVTRPVVADCDARTLTVNDTTSMLAPSYDWPELTPGTHTLAMTAGTGAATVTWTERWW